MGVWEYGNAKLKHSLKFILQNMSIGVVGSGIGNEFFSPTLPYPHTPILFSVFKTNKAC
jgi:hypothetical protein